jgi:hypothetical protein
MKQYSVIAGHKHLDMELLPLWTQSEFFLEDASLFHGQFGPWEERRKQAFVPGAMLILVKKSSPPFYVSVIYLVTFFL